MSVVECPRRHHEFRVDPWAKVECLVCGNTATWDSYDILDERGQYRDEAFILEWNVKILGGDLK